MVEVNYAYVHSMAGKISLAGCDLFTTWIGTLLLLLWMELVMSIYFKNKATLLSLFESVFVFSLYPDDQ